MWKQMQEVDSLLKHNGQIQIFIWKDWKGRDNIFKSKASNSSLWYDRGLRVFDKKKKKKSVPKM